MAVTGVVVGCWAAIANDSAFFFSLLATPPPPSSLSETFRSASKISLCFEELRLLLLIGGALNCGSGAGPVYCKRRTPNYSCYY